MRIKQPEFLSAKVIGVGIMIISILLGLVILSYTLQVKELNSYLHQDCPLPAEVCPFKTTVPSNSVYGFTLVAVLVFIGILLILFEPQKKEGVKIKEAIKTLSGEERNIYQIILGSGGVMFQSELVEKSGLSKVKVSRLLDRLEGKGLTERKRRGMSNAIVVRH